MRAQSGGPLRDLDRGGISALTAIGLVFVVLKLVGVVDWSWWWVLAPFWAPMAFAAACVVTVLAFVALAAVVRGR